MKNILVIAALVLVTLYGIIITINYIDINTKKGEMYDQIPVTKDPNQSVASDSIKPYRYEIRIQNDYDNESRHNVIVYWISINNMTISAEIQKTEKQIHK